MLQTKGTFDQNNLSTMLISVIQSSESGRLEIGGETIRGVLRFLPRHLVAAEISAPSHAYGDDAIRSVLTWVQGWYEFHREEVLLARLARESRVRVSLETFLGQNEPQNQPVPIESRSVFETQDSSRSVSTTQESGILSTLETIITPSEKMVSSAFIKELRSLCAKLLGPAGGLILEDAAEISKVNLEKLSISEANILVVTLKSELPERHQEMYVQTVIPLMRQYKLKTDL